MPAAARGRGPISGGTRRGADGACGCVCPSVQPCLQAGVPLAGGLSLMGGRDVCVCAHVAHMHTHLNLFSIQPLN